MTDEELVKQLRNSRTAYGGTPLDAMWASAAARIEALTADNTQLRAAIEYVLDGYGLEPPNFERKEWEDEDDVDWIVIHLRDALNFGKTDK